MPSTIGPNSPASQPIPADPKLHCYPIAKITSEYFAGGQYVDEISRQYIGSCHYDWNTSRLIFVGDELVHHWGVWNYSMRLEDLELQVAGVGAVVTHEPYRKQGLMQQAALASLEAMSAHGYDLSVLRGRHYVKFGYARAWNYVTYRLQADELAMHGIQPGDPPPIYQPLSPKHMDEINALYNHSYAGHTGTAVRPTYTMLESNDMRAHGWFNESGQLQGYLRAVPSEDKTTLQCLEACGDLESCLAVLGDLFTKGEFTTLTFFTLPHPHPLLQHLRRGAVIAENRYFHNTGWRVKLINLDSTLKKLRPRLETRLQESQFARWRGMFYLDGGDQQASLQIEAGKIQVRVGIPSEHSLQAGPALARLLIGSDEPDEIIRQEEIRCTGSAANLAAVLFPNLNPVMSQWDEY